MKTIKLFLVAFLLGCSFSQAAVITVSNNPNSPGQYTSLQAAIDAAVANDILYVHGSGISYGSVVINKLITIIGDGPLPDKSLHLPTKITQIIFGLNPGSDTDASGTSIYGCDIGDVIITNSIVSDGIYYGLSNITLKRNRISQVFGFAANASCDNAIIQNNIIGNFASNGGGPLKFSNSLISNNVIGNFQSVQASSAGNTIVSNNIFYGSVYGSLYCLFSNNIFYFQSIVTGTSNTYTKNMFFNPFSSSTFDQFAVETNENSFSGNLYNQDPEFIEVSEAVLGNYGFLQPYSYTNPTGPFINFNLAATSQGKNYGTDGTDVGIHGGTSPYVQGSTTDSRFRYFPQPAIPQMMEMNILNSSVLQNGTLNVNFTAKKND